MAQFNQGANGAFSGKVGSVIGSNWRDIDYMRGLSKRTSKKDPSAKQLAVQARFTVLSQFLLLIKGAVDRGFSNEYIGRSTTFNLAIQANQEALAGTDLEPTLDYSKVVISKGLALPKPSDCKMTEGVQGHLSVSWRMYNTTGASAEDKVTVVIHCPEKLEAMVYMDGFVRQDEVADIEIPGNWSGSTVYGYLFVTNGGGVTSSTAYAGALPIL